MGEETKNGPRNVLGSVGLFALPPSPSQKQGKSDADTQKLSAIIENYKKAYADILSGKNIKPRKETQGVLETGLKIWGLAILLAGEEAQTAIAEIAWLSLIAGQDYKIKAGKDTFTLTVENPRPAATSSPH